MGIQQQIIDLVIKELSNDFPNTDIKIVLGKPISQAKKIRSTGWFELTGVYSDEKMSRLKYSIMVHEIDSFTCASRSTQKKLDGSITNLREFIENTTGDGINYNNVFLYILIHELGHVFLVNDVERRKIGKQFRKIHDINVDTIRLAFSIDNINDNSKGPNLYSMLFLDELLADKYAMTKFLPLWNKVKQLTDNKE